MIAESPIQHRNQPRINDINTQRHLVFSSAIVPTTEHFQMSLTRCTTCIGIYTPYFLPEMIYLHRTMVPALLTGY
jgi:hypothetical protein